MAPTGFTFSSDPTPEVTAYLRQKALRPAFRWSEVWGQEHAHAFTVAKAVQADVLIAIRDSLQTAIDKGVPYEAWARDLTPELKRLGWWGDAVDMADPATGEVKPRELGTPRRLRTIYQANLRSARAAGQWERGQRTKSVLPFYLYQLGPSERHRPEHQAKEGMVRPVDDAIWTTWFPPNGWGCKCWLRQITRAEALRRGVTPDFEVPTTTYRRVRDDGTVERETVPVGIDAGWATNPGRSRMDTLMTNATDRLLAAGGPAARVLTADFWAGSTPEAFAATGGRWFAPVAAAPAGLVMVSGETMRAKLVKHGATGERRMVASDFGRVQRILDQGRRIDQGGGKAAYLLEEPDGWWLAAVKTTRANELILSSLYPVGERRLRKLGVEV